MVGSVLFTFVSPIMCLFFLSSVLWCSLWLLHKNDVQFIFIFNCLFVCSCLIYVICVSLRIMVSTTYCVVFLFSFSSSCVSYAVLSIFIAPSVFSNVYLCVHWIWNNIEIINHWRKKAPMYTSFEQMLSFYCMFAALNHLNMCLSLGFNIIWRTRVAQWVW